jgi:hypothetical protein
VPTHTHHSAADLAEWNAYSAATRAMADQIASLVLWGATGRLYGACATIARPVLCPRWPSNAPSAAGVPAWMPVDVGSGEWINWPSDCGCSSSDPFRTKLDGPVSAVTSIRVAGAVLNPANYRVDQMEWLVRTDGVTWPLWQDISLPGTDPTAFVVNYTRGNPVPAELLAMAGTYALEIARSMSPGAATACRLPSRASSITRQGVTIEMVDPLEMLSRGLTGIPEVDAVVRALNPQGFLHRPRALVPGGTAPVVSA